MAAQPLQAADQHPQPGRVEKVHALEVDDDLPVALADQLDQSLTQARRAVDVDLSLDGQHRERRSAVVYLQTELHRRVLPDHLASVASCARSCVGPEPTRAGRTMACSMTCSAGLCRRNWSVEIGRVGRPAQAISPRSRDREVSTRATTATTSGTISPVVHATALWGANGGPRKRPAIGC